MSDQPLDKERDWEFASEYPLEPVWQERRDKIREENKTLQELYKHRAQMAPHQKDRQAGDLLLRSIKEIEILIDAYILKRKQVEYLQGEVVNLRTEAANLRQLLKDECHEDTEIRKLAMPIIGEQKAEGDSNGVPTITDVVEEVIRSLLAAMNLAEQVRLQETRLKIKAEEDLAATKEQLRYAFENLPYPDTLTGNSEYDKARIALGIELDKCKPIPPEG